MFIPITTEDTDMTAKEFIEALDQMHCQLYLQVEGNRWGYAYTAPPEYEPCFGALSKHFGLPARREELCDQLLWMGRIEDRRPLGITADGEKVYPKAPYFRRWDNRQRSNRRSSPDV